MLANVAYGAPFGALGAVISAWPALAFVGAAEMLMTLVRANAGHPVPPPQTSADTAMSAYRASVAADQPLSARQLAARHGISRRKAGQIVSTVAREANGTN